MKARLKQSRISNLRFQILRLCLCVSVSLCLIPPRTGAQDSREALGPKDAPGAAAAWKKSPHPLTRLMAERNSALRAELRGKHPRVYVTEEEIDALRTRARTTHRDIWRRALENVRALKTEPAPAPAQERRAQNEVGIGIAEAALAYKIEGDKKYLDAARKYMDAAVSYDVWGYTYNKPNVDLAAGHLLYGLGWGYDLLYKDLTQAERTRYRDKLAKQARLLADYYKPKPGRTYSYSQNHVFIPIAGLGVAAYALYDEERDAPEWAELARAIYDRVLETYSADGYYYEGFEYWVFSTPWLVHYLDAHAHATGEDLYDRAGFREMHEYVAHSMLPSGQYVFDFGDIFEGPLTRAGKGEEYPRTHPGGHFHTNYNLLYRLASRFKSGEAQGVAQWLEGFGQVNAEDFWSLVWYDPKVVAVPIERQARWHHFEDHGVVYWRSGWGRDATAFAFKCGPPEGHATLARLKEFPDWHLSSGHAHPDANSFIIYAGGRYLTGDSGYAGVPLTAHHNSLLVDGRGQAKEGEGHDAFDGVPYEQLNRVRIVEAQLGERSAVIRGDAAAAYDPALGLTRFERRFEFDGRGFDVTDELESSVPRTFTALVHADDVLKREGAGRFSIDASGARLDILIEAPKDARAVVEENVLTAPGPPGSVDKGERQVRGRRLAVSTPTPQTRTRFRMRLSTGGN
ncbi:MAG: heparinase II/III family protein [Acidobacteria bacterium]|nr:heparinase II/III family protein [Acidobacteriota bacterium]